MAKLTPYQLVQQWRKEVADLVLDAQTDLACGDMGRAMGKTIRAKVIQDMIRDMSKLQNFFGLGVDK